MEGSTKPQSRAVGSSKTTVRTTDRELIATRLFNAPRELVFSAWSDPSGISNWWGPRGFTTTTLEMDFRSGGIWRFTMHGPDGTDWPNRVEYTEVIRPERLVYKHSGEAEFDPIRFEVHTDFLDRDGMTELHMRMTFETAELLKHVAEFGAVEGLYDTLDRLSEQLAVRK